MKKAIENGNFERFSKLLENETFTVGEMNNAMYVACTSNITKPKIIELLLNNGVNPNLSLYTRYGDSNSFLSNVISRSCGIIYPNPNSYKDEENEEKQYLNVVEAVKILIERGADIHANDNESFSRAICNANIDVLKILKTWGAYNDTWNETAIIGLLDDSTNTNYSTNYIERVKSTLDYLIFEMNIPASKAVLDRVILYLIEKSSAPEFQAYSDFVKKINARDLNAKLQNSISIKPEQITKRLKI